MPLSEGAQFAGYTVVRLLGAEAMGEVYLVRHPRLPRFEALKILRADLSADPDYQQRFNRDVKPANIMISHPDDGSTPRIMLSDFGIARPVDDTTGLTVTNMTVGTVDYCSPRTTVGPPTRPTRRPIWIP